MHGFTMAPAQEVRKGNRRTDPGGRLGKPEEVGDAVVFPTKDESGCITALISI